MRVVNTGGRVVTERDNHKQATKRHSNATLIFSPGAGDAHSSFHTLDPGKAWIVSYLDSNVAQPTSITVLRHSMTHRSPACAENVHDKEDMFDFIRTNGYQEMVLGGEPWVLDKDNPLLIISVPGTYSFLCDSVDYLDTLTVTYEEFTADALLKYLPTQYFGGIK